jgi:hypothetical protein
MEKQEIRAISENGARMTKKFMAYFAMFLVFVIVGDIVYDNYDINYRSPVTIERRKDHFVITNDVDIPEEMESPLEVKNEPLTDMEIIDQYELSQYIKAIYFLESTHGKNDGCKDQGKFNGYGYGQNATSWNCFDSFEEVTEKVNNWLEDRLASNGDNIVEAVCYYNTGISNNMNCAYGVTFMEVI